MKNEVILLTSPGASAIAVVRIIGPGVIPFLQEHFSRRVKPLRTTHGDLHDGEVLIDDPVIVLAPDCWWADINLHGGPWVVEATLRLAEECGFARIAASVPLPSIAVDSDDLIEREVLASLPLATTELAVRTLLSQREAWRPLSADTASFSREQLEAIWNDRFMDHLLHPPTIAIVGIPNAGKSTLANQLFAQERSITADLPGTTRDWVGELANIDGLAVRLIDTPGLRETHDIIERTAIERSRQVIDAAALVLVLLDVTQPMELQNSLLEQFPEALVLANKVDRNPEWAEIPSLRVAATRGDGIDVLRMVILRHFGCEAIDSLRPRCWTSRQREYVATSIAVKQERGIA